MRSVAQGLALCLALVALSSCSRGRRDPLPVPAIPTAAASPAAQGPIAPSAATPLVKDCSGHRQGVMGAECWSAGASCEGHGDRAEGAELRGTIVKAGSVHGGCNVSTFTLIYEPKTSPLRVRVCSTAPPPRECPAMVNDFASWNIEPLLAASGATRAVLVDTPR